MLILGKPQVLINRAPRGFGPLAEAETLAALAQAREANKFGWKVSRDPSHQPDDVVVSDLGYRAMVELSLRLRCSRDLFWLVRKLRAGSLGDVVRVMNKINWTDILPTGTQCAVQANSVQSLVYNENLIKRVAGEELTKLGYVVTEKESAAQTIDLSLFHNQLSVSLSLPGRPLRYRGYKKEFVATASIREDLAACITEKALQFSRRQETVDPSLVYVPFAGSGTLGFEAVLALRNIPLFPLRQNFAALDFLCTPATTRGSLTRTLLQGVSKSPITLEMLDIEPDQAQACQQNTAHFTRQVNSCGAVVAGDSRCDDFFKASAPSGESESLFAPLNPPYGNRIGGDANAMYKKIGDTLARFHGTISGYCLAPSQDSAELFLKHLKPKASELYEIDHGGSTVSVANFTATPRITGRSGHPM